MEILQGFVDAVVGIFEDSGLLTLNWQNYVMIGISIVLLYLAIKKQYEPLLLLPIAFGKRIVQVGQLRAEKLLGVNRLRYSPLYQKLSKYRANP